MYKAFSVSALVLDSYVVRPVANLNSDQNGATLRSSKVVAKGAAAFPLRTTRAGGRSGEILRPMDSLRPVEERNGAPLTAPLTNKGPVIR